MNGDEIDQEAGEINQSTRSEAQSGRKHCAKGAFHDESGTIQARLQQEIGEREGARKSSGCKKATRHHSTEKESDQITCTCKNHAEFARCLAFPYRRQTVAAVRQMSAAEPFGIA